MDDTDTKAVPVPEPKTATMSMPRSDITAIIAVGVTLIAVIVGATLHIENRFDAAAARSDARFEKFFSEAAADRRAADAKMEEFGRRMDQLRRDSDAKMDEWRRDTDAKMDEFRSQMQRFGQRQAHLEGQLEAGAGR